jgi:hypothetical protein
MFTYQHSLDTKAAPETIYALYSDVSTWPAWDDAITAMRLDGPFAAGASGTLGLKDGPTLPFTLTAVLPNRGFTDETPVPDGVIRFAHDLQPLPDGGTRITHRVSIDGPAADELGPRISAGIPHTVATLAALAAASAASAI